MVFVSYSTVDQEAAEAVCASLESRDVRCWMAPRDILPGEDWGSAIVNALEACEVMVLIFSDQANYSPHIRREVAYAVRREVPLAIMRVDAREPTEAFRLFQPELAAALDSERPLEDRLMRLKDTVSGLLSSVGAGLPALAPSSASQAAVSPKAISRLLRAALVAAVVVTVIRVIVASVALTEDWKDDMDANAARGYLAFSLPLHFASALSILSLVVVWFCGVCSRFGVGSSGAVLDAFLRPPGNIAAPGRLVHDLYTTALPGASLRVVRWWWPLCVTASGLTAAMPIMATAFQGGATPLLVSDATLTILWALNICLFRLIMKRVDEAATPEALLPVRANAAAH